MNPDEPNGLLDVIPIPEFCTNFKPTTDYAGSRAKKFHNIATSHGIPWDIRSLAILLNEYDDLTVTTFKHSAESSTEEYFKMSFAESGVSRNQSVLLVKIYSNWTIEVSASIRCWQSRTSA